MAFAKVSKESKLLLEVNSVSISPDTGLFWEIETSQMFSSTNDYHYNFASGVFIDVGVKQDVAIPPKQEIVQSAFSSADNFRFRGKGYEGLALKSDGVTPLMTSIDWLLAEERFINGTHVMLSGHVFGDKYSIDIVDKAYAYAGILYPAQYDSTGDGSTMLDWSVVAPTGVVLDTFISDWFVVADMEGQKPIKLEYPARLLAGLYIRLNYTTLSISDIKIRLNGFMHKKTV